MSSIEISVEVADDVIAAARENALDLRPAFKEAIANWRELIAEEFDTQSWRAPSGAPRPWAATKPFAGEGTFGFGKILNRTGRLRDAWLGRGEGSFERVNATSASFGVTGTVGLYGSVHRGGSGEVRAAQSRIPFVQKVTPKMRVFLGLAKGVWLKKTTTELVTPRRPHATINPEIRTRITAIFAAHVFSGAERRVAA